jgi:hypothetical protein
MNSTSFAFASSIVAVSDSHKISRVDRKDPPLLPCIKIGRNSRFSRRR